MSNNGFTKLFNSIITSSIWSEDDKTRLMWITMLAASDAQGFVTGSIPGMAAISRMSVEDAEKSIKALTKPDPYSRSKEYDGRRLLECEGGWLIANYQKYRQKRDPEKRRQQNREAQRRYKRKQKVSQGKPESAQAEAEADIPPKSPKGMEARFNEFWKAYPKKRGKKEAEKVFGKIKPSDGLLKKMIDAIEQQNKSEQWNRERPRYIPNPATWLNRGHWEDEEDVTAGEAGIVKFTGAGPSAEFLKSQLDELLNIPEKERTPKDRAEIKRLQVCCEPAKQEGMA